MTCRIRPLAFAVVIAALAAAACGDSSPATPSASVVTISAPKLLEPASGAQLADNAQPITLVVENATTNGKNAVTYTFEVATDQQFASKVYTKTGVAAGTNGRTSQQADRLAADKAYFWRARGEDPAAATVGTWAAAASFSIGAAIRIDAPAMLEPLNGAPAGGARPLFRIRNAVRAPEAGSLTYTFDISETPDFQPVLATGTAQESSTGETEWRATRDLAARNYYWRVKAVASAGSASSAYSAAQPFRAWPDEIDPRTVTYLHGPNFSDWPITRTLQRVTQGQGTPDEVCTYFTRQGQWPPVVFYNEPDVLVEGNQWYFAKINGKWYGVPGEWFRPGVSCKYGQSASDIGKDSTQDEPFHSWVPKPGELVGYAVSTPARNYPEMRSMDERSQIILIPWR